MRHLLLLAVLAAFPGPLLADSAGAPRPDAETTKYGERRAYFRDWLAACRPGGYCSVLSYVGSRGHLADYVLRVERPASGDSPGVIYTPVAIMPADNQTLLVTIDGDAPVLLDADDAQGWRRREGDAVNELRFSPARAESLLPVMRDGRFMTISFTEESGREVAPRFSLRGLTAALAWIETARLP